MTFEQAVQFIMDKNNLSRTHAKFYVETVLDIHEPYTPQEPYEDNGFDVINNEHTDYYVSGAN